MNQEYIRKIQAERLYSLTPRKITVGIPSSKGTTRVTFSILSDVYRGLIREMEDPDFKNRFPITLHVSTSPFTTASFVCKVDLKEQEPAKK